MEMYTNLMMLRMIKHKANAVSIADDLTSMLCSNIWKYDVAQQIGFKPSVYMCAEIQTHTYDNV